MATSDQCTLHINPGPPSHLRSSVVCPCHGVALEFGAKRLHTPSQPQCKTTNFSPKFLRVHSPSFPPRKSEIPTAAKMGNATGLEGAAVDGRMSAWPWAKSRVPKFALKANYYYVMMIDDDQ